jgi:DNA-directed RNA polymerase specialized sigma24 family protein
VNTPLESFITELARSSGHSLRILQRVPARGRDDVLSDALLSAWENRHEYAPPQLPEAWFAKYLRAAARRWRKGERSHIDLTELDEAVPDETSALAEIQSEIDRACTEFGPVVTEIADRLLRTYTDRQLETDYGRRAVTGARTLLRKLERKLGGSRPVVRVLRARTTEPEHRPLAKIDHEIARIDFPPPEHAECPPCYRCLWWMGYLPNGRHDARMQVVEEDVRVALAAIEARKIEIANAVRSW